MLYVQKERILIYGRIVERGGGLGRSKEFCHISIYVRGKYPIDCIGYSISSLANIRPILEGVGFLDDFGDYRRDGFNKFGDYIYRSEAINMIGKMDELEVCSGWSIEDLSEKYIPYVNRLISEGYEVVYIPNFIPKLACNEADKLSKFHRMIFAEYGIESFDKAQLLFNERYFYISAYHLTNEGVVLKTSILENHLSHYLDNRQ